MKTVYKLITVAALLLCLALQAYAYDQANEAIKAGQQKLQQKDYTGARSDASAALQLAKNPAERYATLMFMGQVSDGAGDFARARSEYQQVLDDSQATMQQKADATNRIANSWLRDGQFATARDTYSKCLSFEKLPDYLRYNALCGVASCYGKEKNLPAMVAAIDTVMQTNGAAWSKYTLLRDCAVLAKEKNDANQGIAAWKQVVTLPGLQQKYYGEAISKAFDLLAGQNKLSEAQQFAEKIAQDGQMAPGDRFQARLLVIGIKASGKADVVRKEAAKAAEEFKASDLQPEARLNACNAAGKFFMTLRQYAVVREFISMADALYIPEQKKIYQCRFVDKAPSSVEGWLSSPILSDPKNLETRFEEYDRKAADLLIYDVRSERTSTGGQGTAQTDTAFAMACDDNGWYIFVKCADSEAEKVAAGLLGGGQLEMYFTPAYGDCYYQWLFGFPTGKLDPVEWDSPSRHHRSMETYCKSDVAVLDKGFGASFFFPWEMMYDNLPKDGDSWRFGLLNWTRAGGVSWGGKVHEIHKWGQVQWSGLTPERMLAIKRKLVMKGFGNYQKTRDLLVIHWKDEMLGDPAFYRESLLPVITKLDEYGKSVGGDMTPAQIETLFTEAVPDWMEFGYTVSELRQDYLQKTLFNTAKR